MTERTPDRRDGLQEFKQPSLSSVSTSLSGVRGDGCLAAAACILGCDPESVPRTDVKSIASATSPSLAFYNDIDSFCFDCLRRLIDDRELPQGRVDRRSILHVKSQDLEAYRQCHFFAGIGGWPLALRMAGWPEEIECWTGSCPCQPYSTAGKGRGDDDSRNIWGEFYRLIRECRPKFVFGEQVANAIRYGWLDRISTDLEREGYAVGAAVLGAHSINAPHKRQRLYWVADSTGNGRERLQRSLATQVQKDRTLKALDAWHGTGNPFEQWKKLLAKPYIRRVDDGISSTVDIRPRLRAYGNAVVPQVAAEFVCAFMETCLDSTSF